MLNITKLVKFVKTFMLQADTIFSISKNPISICVYHYSHFDKFCGQKSSIVNPENYWVYYYEL